MTNEVLCKFLCHNICVVHQSHIELGIVPEFWGNRLTPGTNDAKAIPRFAQSL